MQLLSSNISKQFKYVRHFCSQYKKFNAPWKILFFGTDEFSLASLKVLHGEYKNGMLLSKLEIVTTVSSHKANHVQKFAEKEKLQLHSFPYAVPQNVFDLGLVVSFGHLLPESVISNFPLGVLNVHASLLPRWRGAAPIIYAIANGDKKTGITIMRIKPGKFDIGDIVTQIPIDLPAETTMPELYDRLAVLGANSLINCLKQLPDNLKYCRKQEDSNVTYAPRIKPTIANVFWNKMTAYDVYNLARALHSLYYLTTTWHGIRVKLINIQMCVDANSNSFTPGQVVFDKHKNLTKVQCCDGNWISVEKIGVSNKKPMDAKDFNNGYINKHALDKRLFC